MYAVSREGDAAGAIRDRMKKLLDFSDVLPKIGRIAAESQKRNIDESRSPEGVPFAPLKHSRAAGHPYGDKPLLDTTNMYQSIHFEVRGPIEVFAGPSLSQAEYFPFVNQGRPSKGVPARTFIGLRTEDHMEIENLMAEHAATAFAG